MKLSSLQIPFVKRRFTIGLILFSSNIGLSDFISLHQTLSVNCIFITVHSFNLCLLNYGYIPFSFLPSFFTIWRFHGLFIVFFTELIFGLGLTCLLPILIVFAVTFIISFPVFCLTLLADFPLPQFLIKPYLTILRPLF